MTLKKYTVGALLLLNLGISGPQALARDYPDHAVTVVVPQAVGAGSDVVARIITNKMAQVLKQPIIVDNRSGAGGNIGTVHVAKAKPDGYTLLMASVGHAINPTLYKNAGFDPLKDFSPVASFADGTLILIAGKGFKGSTVKDVIDQARARPKELFYASAGNGTINHLAGVMFEKMADIKMTHVPYRTPSAAANDVASGQIPLSFQALASSYPYVQAGTVQVLGVTNPKRLKALPNAPTLAETLPGFEIVPWYGLFAPAGTPDDILDKLNEAVNEALADKQVQSSLEAQGVTAAPKTREQFDQQINQEVEKWSQIVKQSGARVD